MYYWYCDARGSTYHIFTGVGTFGKLWVQGAESLLLMALWWRDSKILQAIWSCDKTGSWGFCAFVAIFTVILTRVPTAKVCSKISSLLWFYDEKGIFVPEYCGCRIHCLHPLAEYCGCRCTHCTHGSYAYGHISYIGRYRSRSRRGELIYLPPGVELIWTLWAPIR